MIDSGICISMRYRASSPVCSPLTIKACDVDIESWGPFHTSFPLSTERIGMASL